MLYILLSVFSVSWAERSIPLPRQTVYVPQGFAGGMGIGTVGQTRCKNMAIWQVQGDYFYAPQFSAGLNMVLYGGNADKQTSMTYQRYYLQAKFHRPRDRYTLFIGPILGFDNTNLQELRRELRPDDEEPVPDEGSGDCAASYGTQGISLGYETGLGVLLSQNWGMTAGHAMATTTDRDALLAFSLGVNFNLWNHWERLQTTLQDAWLLLEWRGDLDFHSLKVLHSLVFGVSLGI